MMDALVDAGVPGATPSPVFLPRRLIVLTASKACLPEVEGWRVVPVTSVQDLLVGLDGVPDDTPWTEWGQAPLGRPLLRRHLQARGGPRVRLVSHPRDAGVCTIDDEVGPSPDAPPARSLQ
ncbi:hypothetical protein ACSSVZ_005433 [Amorphus sp. MBR-141]